jgi:hypothetical protein
MTSYRMTREQIPVRCTLMRGGTSKAVFLRECDVPRDAAADGRHGLHPPLPARRLSVRPERRRQLRQCPDS